MPKHKTQKTTPLARYRCTTGVTVDAKGARPAQRFEDGQFIDAEIVKDSPWLLEQGLVVAETEEKQ